MILPPFGPERLDQGFTLEHAPLGVVGPHIAEHVPPVDSPVQREDRDPGAVGGLDRGNQGILVARAEDDRARIPG